MRAAAILTGQSELHPPLQIWRLLLASVDPEGWVYNYPLAQAGQIRRPGCNIAIDNKPAHSQNQTFFHKMLILGGLDYNIQNAHFVC